MIYPEISIDEHCKKFNLSKPDLTKSWAECEVCKIKMVPYKPFVAKDCAGLEHNGVCLECGIINKNQTFTYVITSEEQIKFWNEALQGIGLSYE